MRTQPKAGVAVELPVHRLAPAIRSRGFHLGKARARRTAAVALLGFLALMAVVVEGPRPMTTFGGSKVDIAYPQWANAILGSFDDIRSSE